MNGVNCASIADDRWHIEGSFRDGSYRVRDDQGQYKSLSVAILEETSEVNSFDEDELAKMFEVGRDIIVEHLGHLRQEGLIEGDSGRWEKPKDFDPYDDTRRQLTEEQKWVDQVDDSLY